MAWTRALLIMFFLVFYVTLKKKTYGEVQFVRTEIKRNNITLPRFAANAASKSANATNSTAAGISNTQNNVKALKEKGEKKSEVYVVNNGLLLLHPKKVVTISGVKKSTEPAPPSINYHVIKKLKNNNTNTDVASKLLENHVNKRSLTNEKLSKTKHFGYKKRRRLLTAARRLVIPGIFHGRILSVNKTQRLGKRKWQLSSSKQKKSCIRCENGHMMFALLKRVNRIRNNKKKQIENFRKDEIESPLFDDDQDENLKNSPKSKLHKRRRAHKRAKSVPIPPIEKLPDIKSYFDKPDEIREYPRFRIRSFEASEYPRFPLSPSASLIYPRFPESIGENEIIHRYPIRKAMLGYYPRYPEMRPISEFPRYEKNLKRFSEYPRFEEIKPLDLDEAPRFSRYPEPTPIPDIKDIGDAEKRSRPKRDKIIRKGIAMEKRLDADDDDDEDDDEDNDASEDDESWKRGWYGDLMENSYTGIAPVGPIGHIRSPPRIPAIADIPFIPDIPPLHSIHGIRPISSIKPIPSAEKTGSSRTLAKETGAKFESNNVSVKDLSTTKTGT